MADKHIADCESGFRAIAMGPDACKVGKPVVPFDSTQLLSSKNSYSPDVFARGVSVLHQGCIIKGTQSNAGKGVMTGTSGGIGHCIVLNGSPTVLTNGLQTARHESMCAMNNGNAMGQLNTGTAPPNAAIVANKQPCNDPPKTSKALEQLKALRDDIAKLPMNPSQLDKYVDFEGASKSMQGGIDSFRAGDDSWAITQGAAGVARGLAGFVKDAVMGLGGLAYAGSKRVIPGLGQLQLMQDQADIAILQENMRLGNVCLEGAMQQAKAMGTALAKPVTDAWERGDYAEAITRGGVELLTIVLPMAKAGWAGKAGKAGEVGNVGSKTSATTKTAEALKASEAASAKAAQEIAEAAKKPPVAPKEPPPPTGKPPPEPPPAKTDGVHIKGAYGEKVAHDKMLQKGHEPVGNTNGEYKAGSNGIDGVYKNANPPPDYIITEAKYGTSQLSDTIDGKQMSDDWVTNRLVDKVGDAEARLIENAMRNGNVEKWLINIGADGATTMTKLGAGAQKLGSAIPF